MYAFADYVKDYEECKKSLELIKKILSCKEFQNLFSSPATKELRESLVDLFAKPELSAICKNCRGDCCVIGNFKLTPFELFCLVIDNPKFELPQPDWQFLEEELKFKKIPINNHCLFLSSKGCLLRGNRPIICLLFYDCELSFKPNSLTAQLDKALSPQEREEIFYAQASAYVEARGDFCLRVIQAAKIPENSSLATAIKGDLAYGRIGYAVCLEALKKILYICKNNSRS